MADPKQYGLTYSGNGVSVQDTPVVPANPTEDTVITGIRQTAYTLSTAIRVGIRDVQAAPYLLNYCFADWLYDPFTPKAERDALIQSAKDYLTKVTIPVLMYPLIENMQFPCISIAQMESTEIENTLGDINPQQVTEDGDAQTPYLIGPFTPLAVDIATGIITIPPELQPVYTTPQMVVIDALGNSIPIIKDGDGSDIYIAPNINHNLNNILLKNASPDSQTQIESAVWKAKYSIGCHAQGSPTEVSYLSSLVLFILQRYKQNLIESRGFEQTRLAVGPLIPNSNLENGKENVFSVFYTIDGNVRHVWPKWSFNKFSSVQVGGTQAGTSVPGSKTSIW